MGKFFDWIMVGGDFEAMQRVTLFKKIGNKLDSMTEEQIDEQIEILQKMKENC